MLSNWRPPGAQVRPTFADTDVLGQFAVSVHRTKYLVLVASHSFMGCCKTERRVTVTQPAVAPSPWDIADFPGVHSESQTCHQTRGPNSL